MKCPDCGTEMMTPDKPGPITSCECGWYLMGFVKDAGDD